MLKNPAVTRGFLLGVWGMNMIRLLLDGDLADGMAVDLPKDQAHYLVSVMRQGVGDQLLVFNGQDGEWLAEITEVFKKSTTLRMLRQVQAQPKPSQLTLIQAVIKRPRLETIIEKATELGAGTVQLVQTEYVQSPKVNMDRLVRIATEAAEQTGRLDVPTVNNVMKLADALPADRPLIFCDEMGGGDIVAALSGLSAAGNPTNGNELARATARRPLAAPAEGVEQSETDRERDGKHTFAAILIGPEGGFSPEERDHIRSLPNAVPVSLGPRVLRADTAAIAALSLFQATAGDWKTSE